MAMDIYTRSGAVIGRVTPIDTVPTSNSNNTVQSGGVYNAIDTAQDKSLTSAVTNLIDKSKVVAGNISTTTGGITTSTTYHVTDFIEVDTSEIYFTPNCDRMGAYDDDKTFISVVTVTPNATYDSGAVSFPTGTRYVRLRIIANGVDGAIFVQAKYYNKNANPQTVYTGFSEDFAEAFPKGRDSLAPDDPVNYAHSINLFDCENDFYQVASGLRGFFDANNGAFMYKYDTITDDSEIPTGHFTIGMDKYYPVTYGQQIVSNKPFCDVVFYNSSKQFISIAYSDSARLYHGLVVPENGTFARISFRGHPTDGDAIHSLSEIKDIVVWTVPNIGSNDYFPNVQYPQPIYQIDGNAVSPNYLDKVIPNMVDSPFLSAMRCMAIREINKREHAWRFGNFNMWIMAGIGGWNMTKKMLMDYGIDFCGFEECVIKQSTVRYKGIAEFLHGWQFPSGFYTNWTDGAESQIDKSFVSRFPVTESTKLWFTTTESNASYLNCKVQLPRYMDVYDPVRILSVYVVHFAITTEATKIAIAQELLEQIATDDSDFIVILGDTNDFGDTDETKHYWATLEAGGFHPVIPLTSNSKTITADDIGQSGDEYPEKQWRKNLIDQFLVSDNIEMVSYGVVNTKDEYGVSSITGSGTNNEPALSDHDFVYADLRFKYDTPRTIVPIET